jgi:hypothetical protein
MPYHPEALTHPHQHAEPSSTATRLPDWEPARLKPQHVEMIKQFVQGIPISRIHYNFKRFGVNYSNRQITRVIQSAKGQEFASLYSAQLHGGIAGLTHEGAVYAPEAFYTEVDIMRNPVVAERHRLNAAQDVMDRTGPVKMSRTEIENRQPTQIFITLSPSQLSQFALPPAQIETEAITLLEAPSTDDE